MDRIKFETFKKKKKNYRQWRIFDYCLYSAIKKLSLKEYGEYPLYSGLSKVKLNQKSVKRGYFPTYTSASWQKDVALAFMKNEGMLIVIDKNIRQSVNFLCCDVSWISKFPDECEILIARSTVHNQFQLDVIDQQKQIQIVSMTSVTPDVKSRKLNIVHND